jgi:serine/threonine-protein kinase
VNGIGVETVPVDLRGPLSPMTVRTAPLEGGIAAAAAGATAALPAADAGRIETRTPPHTETLGTTRLEPRGVTPAPPQAGPPVSRRRPADFRSVAVLAALLALAGVVGSHHYRPGLPRVLVPSLLGQSVTAASSTVRSAGLRIVLDGRRQDPRTPPGLIVAQDPPPGGRVDRESVVRVVVSQGSGLVPNVRGLAFDDAARLVQSAGLRLRRIADIGGHGNDEDRNRRSTIVFQLQAPGTQLAADATVDVVMMARVNGNPHGRPPGEAPGPKRDGGSEGR